MAYGDMKADMMLMTTAMTDFVRAFGAKRSLLDVDDRSGGSDVEHPTKLSRKQKSEMFMGSETFSCHIM